MGGGGGGAGGGGGRRAEWMQVFLFVILYHLLSLLHEKLCGCRVDAGAHREYTGGRSRDAGGTQ